MKSSCHVVLLTLALSLASMTSFRDMDVLGASTADVGTQETSFNSSAGFEAGSKEGHRLRHGNPLIGTCPQITRGRSPSINDFIRNIQAWNGEQAYQLKQCRSIAEVPSGEQFRLFMSVVADAYGDGNDASTFNNGDFFNNGRQIDLVRCYYSQLVSSAANFVNRAPVKELLEDLALRIENSPITNPKEYDTLQQTIVRFAASVQDFIKKKKRGQQYSTLFPCGWSGHAVYCEVVAHAQGDKYDLLVYNSGEGIEHHFSVSTDGITQDKISPVLVFKGIPEQVLFHPTQWRALIEGDVISLVSQEVKTNAATMYKIALGRLGDYLDHIASTAVMMNGQLGGTCMLSGLHHFVHYWVRSLSGVSQEKVGQEVEHALTKAALKVFLQFIQDKSLKNVLPPLEQLTNMDEARKHHPLPAEALHEDARRIKLLQTSRRHILQLGANDQETHTWVGQLSEWLKKEKQSLFQPQTLLDTREVPAQQRSMPMPMTKKLRGNLDFYTLPVALDQAYSSSRPVCTLPIGLADPQNNDAAVIIPAIASLTPSLIDRCFGETFVDWLSAKVLSLDLGGVPRKDYKDLAKVFTLLAEYARQFGPIQPFADHLLALRQLLVTFHAHAGEEDQKRIDKIFHAHAGEEDQKRIAGEIFHAHAGEEDQKRIAGEIDKQRMANKDAPSLKDLPSLKDFDVLWSLRADPLEEPQSLLYTKRLETDLPSVDEAAKYLFFPWDPTSEAKLHDNLHMLCTGVMHVQASNQFNVIRAVTRKDGEYYPQVYDTLFRGGGGNLKSPEKFVLDFKKLNVYGDLKHNNNKPCEIKCDPKSNSRGCDHRQFSDEGIVACILSGQSNFRKIGISPDFFTIRRMLVLYHMLDNAVAGRAPNKGLSFKPTIQETNHDDEDRKKKELVTYNWCTDEEGLQKQLQNENAAREKLPLFLAEAVKERASGLSGDVRGAIWTRTRISAGQDEEALQQFLMRDRRFFKWQQFLTPNSEAGVFKWRLKHDGDNGAVLYDIKTHSQKERVLTPFQRTLLDVGMHASLTRENWLGYLQDNPKCFFSTSCRAATDAILFADKFDPETCNKAVPGTREEFYVRVLKVVQLHMREAIRGEPSQETLLTRSYIRATQYRIQALLTRDSGAGNVAAAAKELRSSCVADVTFGIAHKGPPESAAALARLQYVSACMELLLVSDLHLHGPRLAMNVLKQKDRQVADECFALFTHGISFMSSAGLDPAAVHQAMRARGELLPSGDPRFCKMLGGPSQDAVENFPLVDCNRGVLNMISGSFLPKGTSQVFLGQFPMAVRLSPFTQAVVRVGYLEMGSVSVDKDGASLDVKKLITKDGSKYYFTQKERNTVIKPRFGYRKLFTRTNVLSVPGTVQYQPPQVFIYRWSIAQRRVLMHQETCDLRINSPRVVMDLKVLLGSLDGDVFCWVDEENKVGEITHIDEHGSDDLVATFKIDQAGFSLWSERPTPTVPHQESKQWLHVKMSDVWVDFDAWNCRLICSARPEILGRLGIFSRFHEGRPYTILSNQIKQTVIFSGVRFEGEAVAVRSANSDASWIYSDAMSGIDYAVVEPSEYSTGPQLFLEHGIAHLLLQDQGGKRFVLFAQPLLVRDKREQTFWGLALRRPMLLELDQDSSLPGLVYTTSRSQHITLALVMLKAKSFAHAFAYMERLQHFAPWSEEEVLLLREIAAIPLVKRDPETSYLRLFAIKLLREDCLRFAQTGCSERLRLDEEWTEFANEAVGVAMQTKHLVPVHRMMNWRTFTPTRFFAERDFTGHPSGLRALLAKPGTRLTPGKEMLNPVRNNPLPKMDAESAMRRLVSYRSRMKKSTHFHRKTYQNVFPTGLIDNVPQVQEQYRLLDSVPDPADLFITSQLVLAEAGTFKCGTSDQTSFQIALLARASKKPAGVPGLRPMVEAWEFEEDLIKKCPKCEVVYGMMSLLLFGSSHNLLFGSSHKFFQALTNNLEHFSFADGTMSGHEDPEECCELTQLPHVQHSFQVEEEPQKIVAQTWDWQPLPTPSLVGEAVQSGAELPTSECASPCIDSVPSRGWSAAELGKCIVERVYGNFAPQDKEPYLLFPPGDDSMPQENREAAQLAVLVSLYAVGRGYTRLFPSIDDETKLHCQLHQLLVTATKEIHHEFDYVRKFNLDDMMAQSPAKARTLLLFEYRKRLAIREEQVTWLARLMSDTREPLIQQIMMGGGKTSVLSPILLNLAGFGLFMSPSGVFNQNNKDLAETTANVFGQYGEVIDCHRSKLQQDDAALAWVDAQLQQAQQLDNYVMMLPRTLQCFQNLLIANLATKTKYTLLTKILERFRTGATAIIDEIDNVFDPNFEVNFPLQSSDQDDTAVMSLLAMVFTLDDNTFDDETMTKAKYDTTVKEGLVTQFVEVLKTQALPFSIFMHTGAGKIRQIAASIVSCGASFFLAPELGTGEGDCKVTRHIRVVHLFLSETLVQVIQLRRNVDYGLSHVHPEHGYVIPYSFANRPVEGSKFSCYPLAVGLSFQYWFKSGINKEVFIQIVKDLRALPSAPGGKGALELFYKATHRWFPELKERTSLQLKEMDLTRTHPEVLRDMNVVLIALTLHVLPKIKVSEEQVTNYALNMDNALKRFIGFSGTMAAKDAFPDRADVQPDAMVAQRLFDRTVTNKLDDSARIFRVGEDENLLIHDLVRGDFSQCSALLDCGAFLRDFLNEDVARMILERRDELKVVLYYDDDTNRIVGMHRSSEIKPCRTTQDLLDKGFNYNEIFVYLDQQHTVGTDLRMDPKAKAVLTVGRKTNLEALMQAIMRMRNYDGEQSSDGKQDVLFAYLSEPPEGLAELWQRCKDNTDAMINGMKALIARRKADTLYRRAFLDRRPKVVEDPEYKFVKLAFYKRNDFLVLDTPERLATRLSNIHTSLPFPLEQGEVDELAERVEEAKALAAGLPVRDKPDTEEEQEQEQQEEQEQQAELQAQRLNEDQHFNEDMFTLNPAQMGFMYALCVEMNQLNTKQGEKYHPCVPVSSWLDGVTPSHVYASYSFVLVQPAPRDKVDWWELFEKPWNWPPSDHAQSSNYDESVQLLLDDTRKNVRNVLLMVNKDEPADFQLVLVSSTEALHLIHFCNTDRSSMQSDLERSIPMYIGKFEDQLKKTIECEDPQRRQTKGEFKNYNPLLDHMQQAVAYWNEGIKNINVRADNDAGQKFRNDVAEWWQTRHCTIFDPRALPTAHPDDFLKHLLPPKVLAMANQTTKDSYKMAVVEVLALAGAQTLLHNEAFKQEFTRRMEQNNKFQEVFFKVRQKMGLPFDPIQFSFMHDGGKGQVEEELFSKAGEFEIKDEQIRTNPPKNQANPPKNQANVSESKQVDQSQKVQTDSISSAVGTFKHQVVNIANTEEGSPHVVKKDLSGNEGLQMQKVFDPKSPIKSQLVHQTLASSVESMPGSGIFYEDISKGQSCLPECGCKEINGPEIMAGIIGETAGEHCEKLCSKDLGCMAFSQFRRSVKPPGWDACRLYTTNYQKYESKELGDEFSWIIPRMDTKDWEAITTPEKTNRIGLPSNCMVKRWQSQAHEPLPKVQEVQQVITKTAPVQQVITKTAPMTTVAQDTHDVQPNFDIRRELANNCYKGDGGGKMDDSALRSPGICRSLKKEGRPDMMPNLFLQTPHRAESCLEDAKRTCENDRDCYAVSASRHVRTHHWVCRVHTTSNDWGVYAGWREPPSRPSSEIGCPHDVYKLSSYDWDTQQCFRKIAHQ